MTIDQSVLPLRHGTLDEVSADQRMRDTAPEKVSVLEAFVKRDGVHLALPQVALRAGLSLHETKRHLRELELLGAVQRVERRPGHVRYRLRSPEKSERVVRLP